MVTQHSQRSSLPGPLDRPWWLQLLGPGRRSDRRPVRRESLPNIIVIIKKLSNPRDGYKIDPERDRVRGPLRQPGGDQPLRRRPAVEGLQALRHDRHRGERLRRFLGPGAGQPRDRHRDPLLRRAPRWRCRRGRALTRAAARRVRARHRGPRATWPCPPEQSITPRGVTEWAQSGDRQGQYALGSGPPFRGTREE